MLEFASSNISSGIDFFGKMYRTKMIGFLISNLKCSVGKVRQADLSRNIRDFYSTEQKKRKYLSYSERNEFFQENIFDSKLELESFLFCTFCRKNRFLRRYSRKMFRTLIVFPSGAKKIFPRIFVSYYFMPDGTFSDSLDLGNRKKAFFNPSLSFVFEVAVETVSRFDAKFSGEK